MVLLRIGILPNVFLPFELNRCYGQYALGFIENGHEVYLLHQRRAHRKVDDLPGLRVYDGLSLDELFEISNELDYIIVYTCFSKTFDSQINVLSKGRAKIVIKSENTGRFGTNPKLLNPGFWLQWRFPVSYGGSLYNGLKIASKSTAKALLSAFPGIKRIVNKHIILQADVAFKIIIESDYAAFNLAYVFTELGRPDLIEKILVFPNPVNSVFTSFPLEKIEKRNVVISVGRWKDPQKNVKALGRVLATFLSTYTDWEAVVIGSGVEVLHEILRKYKSGRLTDRIKLIEWMENEKLLDFYRTAKIYLSTSLIEGGFPMAPAEALCMGATVVAPPLEPFQSQVAAGFSGSLSIDSSSRSLAASLSFEAERWLRGERDPVEIAKFWRQKLARDKVVKDLLRRLFT